jgi:S1-C subfamily serine protease
MNTRLIGIMAALAAAAALAAPAANAQPAPEAPPAPPAAREEERAAAEARLREAEERLKEAAREIAELSAQVFADTGIAIEREVIGRARRAMLGVSIGPVGEPGAREDGVKVLAVTPGGPADAAGIRSGDVLVSLGDTRLDWNGDTSAVDKLLGALRDVEPGTEVEVRYQRDGDEAATKVKVRSWSLAGMPFDMEVLRGMLPPDAPHPPQFARRFMLDAWGDMELVSLTPGLGDYFKTEEGVLVVRAPTDDTLGLQDGDVIVDIAGRKPADPGHVVRILRSYSPGERLVMTVVRKGQRRQLEADIPG